METQSVEQHRTYTKKTNGGIPGQLKSGTETRMLQVVNHFSVYPWLKQDVHGAMEIVMQDSSPFQQNLRIWYWTLTTPAILWFTTATLISVCGIPIVPGLFQDPRQCQPTPKLCSQIYSKAEYQQIHLTLIAKCMIKFIIVNARMLSDK